MNDYVNVLFVEDNPDDAELVALELQRAQFIVDSQRVDTRENFLTALQTREWDLIISDYKMPKFNGLEAFNLFQQAGLDIPFIFVSGTLGEERAVEAMRAGARDYILKGNLTRLPEAIRRELQDAQNRAEKRRTEEKARQDQYRLEMAVEASGAGIFEFNAADHAATYVNNRLLEILGCDLETLASTPDLAEWGLSIIHPNDRAVLNQRFRAFLAGEIESWSLDFRLRGAENRWVDVALYTRSTLRDANGRTTRFIGSLLDISEHRRLLAQFQQRCRTRFQQRSHDHFQLRLLYPQPDRGRRG